MSLRHCITKCENHEFQGKEVPDRCQTRFIQVSGYHRNLLHDLLRGGTSSEIINKIYYTELIQYSPANSRLSRPNSVVSSKRE